MLSERNIEINDMLSKVNKFNLNTLEQELLAAMPKDE